MLAAQLAAGGKLEYTADPARHYYLVAPSGRVLVNGEEAQARDGIAITGEDSITLVALEDAEVVMVYTV